MVGTTTWKGGGGGGGGEWAQARRVHRNSMTAPILPQIICPGGVALHLCAFTSHWGYKITSQLPHTSRPPHLLLAPFCLHRRPAVGCYFINPPTLTNSHSPMLIQIIYGLCTSIYGGMYASSQSEYCGLP